ncbi:hypothetical protein HY968_02400 [Candidatus Kaiserbacteria bacterium]|nr:hypothetical protein [Candidatus Kaiserbacteria bacterium]
MSSETPSGGESLHVRNRYDEGESPEFLQAKEKVAKNGEEVRMGGFSNIDEKDKYSEGYKNCIGIVVIGFDPALGKNISFLCHLMPNQVARLEYKHSKVVIEKHHKHLETLGKKLKEIKERCKPGSLTVGIVGGNMFDEEGQEHYDNALNNVGEVIYSTTRLNTYVLHSPAHAKSHGMPDAWRNAYVDTATQQVLLEGTDAMAHIGVNGTFLLSQAEIQKRFREIHGAMSEKGVHGFDNIYKGSAGYIDVPRANPIDFFKTHGEKPIVSNAGGRTVIRPINKSDPQRGYYEHLKEKHGSPVSHTWFFLDGNYEIWKRVSHPQSPRNKGATRKKEVGKPEAPKRKWIRGTKWDDGYYHPSSSDKY